MDQSDATSTSQDNSTGKQTKTPKPELTNLKLTKNLRDTAQQINSLVGSVVPQKVSKDGTIRFFPSSIGDYRKLKFV